MLSEHGNRKWSFDAAHTWAASRKESRIARTVVLKLKTSEFKILTRRHTAGFSTCFLRGADEYRPITATTCRPPTAPAVSPGWRRPQQLLRPWGWAGSDASSYLP